MTTHTVLCESCDVSSDEAEVRDDRREYPRTFLCDECYSEALADLRAERADWYQDDDYLIDGVGFADPGGNSALRAATKSNPRNRPCPTCGRKNRLTPADVARHYQCDTCADAAEGGGF